MWTDDPVTPPKRCATEARRYFDVSLLLALTIPLCWSRDLVANMEAPFTDEGLHAAATVSPTREHYAAQKTLTAEDYWIRLLLEYGSRAARRQDVPPFFRRNRVCYAFWHNPFLDGAPILGDNSAAAVVDLAGGEYRRAVRAGTGGMATDTKGRCGLQGAPDRGRSAEPGPSDGLSDGRQRRHRHFYAHLATQKFQQQEHALLVRGCIEDPNLIGQ